MGAWPLELIHEAMRLNAEGLSYGEIGRRIGKSGDAVWKRLRLRSNSLPKAAFQGKGGSGSASPQSAPEVTPKAASPEPPVSLGQEIRDSRISNGHRIVLLDASPPPLHSESFLDQAKPLVKESAPAVHTSKSRAEAYLCISDLQIPYHHPGALEFCKRVRVEFGIPLENVLCMGDEFDLYWMSRFEKAANAPHTANQEVEAGRTEIARWVAAFPFMRLCDSNHVKGRMSSAASRAGIASQFIRTVREVYNLPETWSWADHWIIKASKAPFRVEHGHVGPGGHAGLRGRPLNRMISTVWGHEHAEPGIVHLNTHGGGRVWGMRTGSLLTTEPVAAFTYNEGQGSRPVGSVGVILDGGTTPLIVRMGR